MNKLIQLCLTLLLLLGLYACSENDGPTDNPVLGYSLDQFISADSVRALLTSAADDTLDYRSLFSYEIVCSNDGYSPRQGQSGGYDLTWDIFRAGYFVPSDEHSTWFPANSGLGGAFMVENADLLRLYRKVRVIDAVTDGVNDIELRGLDLVEVENWNGQQEWAIRLSDFAAGYTVYDSLRFTAPDGYAKTYTPTLVADGYYLLNSEVTTFPSFNSSLPGSQKKFKKLATVEIFGPETGPPYKVLAPQEKLSISFPIPADLSSFQSTDLGK